jgi:hypothetical protein
MDKYDATYEAYLKAHKRWLRIVEAMSTCAYLYGAGLISLDTYEGCERAEQAARCAVDLARDLL